MPDRIRPGDSVASRYRELVREGAISDDAAQHALANRLDALNTQIGSMRLASKSSSLGWLFAKKAQKKKTKEKQ